MKYIIILFLGLIFGLSCIHNNIQFNDFILLEGDLLFQDLDKDSIDNAIEKVTQTQSGYNFTHVGIVLIENKKPVVLEAISKGVVLTPIDTFMKRNLNTDGKPKVVAARLKSKYTSYIPEAIEEGKKLLGKAYDHVYIIGDDNYYCSELIYEMFNQTYPEQNIFKLNPMTFKDPETNKFLPFWKTYYDSLRVAIPEGEPGLNPNGMSMDTVLDLVWDFGK